jgi:UDP-N-acetylmuramate--alanine ligase
MGTNACLGKGEYLVAEADEFDRSFLRLRPVVAVVNNIDLEHLDTYRDLADLKAAFTEFAGTVPFFGAALLGLDDPNVQEIRPLLSTRVRVGTFGLTPQADVTARDLSLDRSCSRFTAVADGEAIGIVEVALPGLHNVKNALAAIAISRELEIPFEACAKALSTFAGVARRFERKGERNGVLVIDDYAHHPTEVSATLGAARQAHPERRLVVLFQPHLFTRTRDQAAGFGAALLAADAVYVLPVYPSRETPIPGITSRLVSEAARSRGHRHVVDLDDRAAVVSRLEEDLKPGDLLVTMGAGDVNRLGEEYLAEGGPA